MISYFKTSFGPTHKAIFLIALVLLLASPKAVHAFSLGKIRVTGSFEESFRAEIPVRSDGQEGLTAEIGDAFDYERIDAERPDFLDKFRITVGDHPLAPGQKIIYISYSEPIYQPSFNLLIKAKLAGGMIMENYFLALDLQKNISMSLPKPEEQAAPSAADEEDLTKVASMLRSLRPGQERQSAMEQPQSAAASTETNESMLEKIRREEREAVEKEQSLIGFAKSPAPENTAKAPTTPVVAPPAPKAPPIALAAIPSDQKTSVRTPAPSKAPVILEPVHIHESALKTPVGKPIPHGFSGTEFTAAPIDMDKITIVTAESPQKSPAMKEAIALVSPSQPTAPAAKAPVVEKPAPVAASAPIAPRVVASIPAQAGGAPSTAMERPRQPEGVSSAASSSSPGYLVLRGDNLFKIASAIGFHGGESRRVAVVAIWLENRDKFTNGNMNALATGRSLDYSGVKERMKSITGQQADALIREQWAEWTGAKPVIAAVKAPRVEPVKLAPATAKAPEPSLAQKPAEPGPSAAPSPTKVASATAASSAAPERIGEGKPYVVHVASFKSQEHSSEFVRLLRSKGLNAFEIICDIPGKGVWRRVVVDRMPNMQEAKALGQTIKRNSISKYTQVLTLPYAISIDGPAPEAQARDLLKKYEGKGLAPYALRDKSTGDYWILVGAYESADSARGDMNMLSRLDLQPKIVQP